MTNKKREEALWKEVDNLAFWSSAISTVLLGASYFIIPSFIKNDLVREFLLGIITNLIPVFLLFALSYAFLRRIQAIRSDRDNEVLIQQITSTIRSDVLNELANAQKVVATELARVQTQVKNLGQTVQEQVQQKKVQILFTTANPVDTSRLRISDEIRQVREGLRNSKFSSVFEFTLEVGVRKSDLQALLIEHQPDIFHFSGMSINEGLILEDQQGHAAIISAQEFRKLISIFRDKVQLVFINGSWSIAIGEEISEEVDFVISTAGAVGDRDAIEFAAAFYQAIGNNVDIETAFELGLARLAGREAQYHLFKPKKDGRRYFIS
jgi:hypothetical protein